MLHKSIIALTLAAASYGACAADFYVVVPVHGKKAATVTTPSITAALSSFSLPTGTVGVNYAGFSFVPLLQVQGDSNFDPNQVTWTVASGSLPEGINLTSNGNLSGKPTTAGLTDFVVQANYKGIVAQKPYSLTTQESNSCATVLASNPSSPSGWYTIDIDGEGSIPAQSYYCDMVSDGGGWTRIVRQTEAAPVTDWNGGVNASSYALPQTLIPAHTQVAFGKDEQATSVDYVNFAYSVGEITKTLVTSPKTGKQYHIARLNVGLYAAHNPEGVLLTDSSWNRSLTFDEVGGAKLTWAFSPMYPIAKVRGYSMLGVDRQTISDTFAWTVWVR